MSDATLDGNVVRALPESKKQERRAALEEIKRRFAGDPAGAREAARLWFLLNSEPVPAEESSSFHLRKQSEAAPERALKAEQALRQNEALADQARSAAREASKLWRKRNPNKVKKLDKKFREQLKSQKYNR